MMMGQTAGTEWPATSMTALGCTWMLDKCSASDADTASCSTSLAGDDAISRQCAAEEPVATDTQSCTLQNDDARRLTHGGSGASCRIAPTEWWLGGCLIHVHDKDYDSASLLHVSDIISEDATEG